MLPQIFGNCLRSGGEGKEEEGGGRRAGFEMVKKGRKRETETERERENERE